MSIFSAKVTSCKPSQKRVRDSSGVTTITGPSTNICVPEIWSNNLFLFEPTTFIWQPCVKRLFSHQCENHGTGQGMDSGTDHQPITRLSPRLVLSPRLPTLRSPLFPRSICAYRSCAHARQLTPFCVIHATHSIRLLGAFAKQQALH